MYFGVSQKESGTPFKSLLFVDPEQNSKPNTLERSAPALLLLAKINGQN